MAWILLRMFDTVAMEQPIDEALQTRILTLVNVVWLHNLGAILDTFFLMFRC